MGFDVDGVCPDSPRNMQSLGEWCPPEARPASRRRFPWISEQSLKLLLMMNKTRRVALLVDMSRAYGRGICEGVAEAAQRQGNWILLPHERPLGVRLPKWLRPGRIDGVIAYIPSLPIAHGLLDLQVPVVDVQGQGLCPGVPVFDTDPNRVADLAVDFFRRAQFRHFAFCGYPGIFFSDRRQKMFAQRLQQDGQSLHVYAPPPRIAACMNLFQRERGAMEYEPGLRRWLAKLPKPVAILACNDIRGQQVINACRAAGIDLFGEVAVIGIDNDSVICGLCRPTLTSIAPDTHRIGLLAAETLANAFAGLEVPAGLQNIPPVRIVERQSTDIVVVDHPVVLRATRIIRDEACRSLSIPQLCGQLDCSRTTLDALFLRHLGHSVAREIILVRLNRAARLLSDTTLRLEDIAVATGFPSAAYFCRFFKRETGQTAAGFRSKPGTLPHR